jgi:hypothetical protein
LLQAALLLQQLSRVYLAGWLGEAIRRGHRTDDPADQKLPRESRRSIHNSKPPKASHTLPWQYDHIRKAE